MTLAALALPFVLQSAAFERTDGDAASLPPQRQVTVELAEAGELNVLLRQGFDVVYQAPSTLRFDLLCDDAELERLRELGFDYSLVHADTSAFYADRLAQEAAAGPPALGGWLSPPYGQGSIGGYYSWSEVASVLDQIAAAFPSIVTPKASIGQSLQGRDLWYVKVSDNPGVDEAEPEVRFDSMHHAREPQSMQTVVWTLLWLTENYGTDALATWLVDNREMWFLPVVNPDGYVYNETTNPGGGGLWRKNRRNNGDGTLGVDLNRNYPHEWGFDDLGSSPITSAPDYRGPSPASEPETVAMIAFISSRSFATAISCHTYSNLWLYPLGYIEAAPANDAQYDEVSVLATEVNNYVYGPGSIVLYLANGVTNDYDHAVHGTLSWIPEIGGDGDGFWPPQSRIVPLAEENLLGFLRTALAAGSWVRTTDEALTDTGDGDGFFEPGETVDLVVSARNSGLLATTTNVVATVTSTHPGLSVSGGGSDDFGPLAPFTSAVGAPIELVVAPTATPGSTLTFELELAWDGYTETLSGSLVVGVPRPILTDDLELDLGWTAGLPGDTATTGLWEYGDPVGTFSGSEPSNPEDDATSGVDNDTCYATGNGSTTLGGDDVDNGLTTLVTPVIDLSGVGSAQLSYARWYADFTTADDVFRVDISDDDGANWVSLEALTGTDNEWNRVTFRVEDHVALTDQVRLRFVAEDDPNNSIVEGAVDDLLVETYESQAVFNLFGSPEIGTSVAFHVAGPPNGAFGVLQSEGTFFFEFAAIEGPLLLDPTTLIVLFDGALGADGLGRFVSVIPNVTELIDVTLYFQGLVGGPGGFELTNRDEITFE